MRSPCRGAVLPVSSSTSMSPLVRHSLGSLPTSLAHPSSDPSRPRRQLTSPQITKWFRKSTPRKLAVTPKKSAAQDAKPSVSGVKRKLCTEPDSDDSLGVALLPPLKNKVRRSSRENDPKLSQSKPQRTESAPMCVLTSVESNCNNQLEQELVKTSDSDSPFSSAQSSVTSGVTSFCSPTVNLPNYVYDPQPRAPIGRRLSPSKRHQSRDWLTQLRLQRQNCDSQSSLSTRSPTGRGQTRHRATKMSKASPQNCRSNGSAVSASSSTMSLTGTKPVSCLYRLKLCIFQFVHLFITN